jgi:hypothetical protein
MLSDRLQKFRGGLVIEFLQFGLDLGIEEHRIGRGDKCPQIGDLGLVAQHRLVGVKHVQERLGRQQVQLSQQRRVDLGARGEQGRAIVEEGLKAGALGFSTSRTILHKSIDGEVVPGTTATKEELIGIGRAVDYSIITR